MTNIERLQNIGIRRLGTPKRGFRYEPTSGRLTQADLDRIDDLKIPPAWTDVFINPAASGRVQAVGKDTAGRWQYLYHQSHTRTQELRKFRRITKFAKAIPKMRATVAGHLRQSGLTRERVLAAVLRVIRKTMKLPGYNVFKYINGDDKPVVVTRRHINEYIKEVMGGSFSAKDFRTWAGTLVCACALARNGVEVSEKKTARNKRIVAAIKETAEALGNTPAVCRGSYVCPEIINSFEKGQVIDACATNLDDLITFRGRGLHKAEQALLKFLKKGVK